MISVDFLFLAFFSIKLVAISSNIYAIIKAHVLLYRTASSEFWLSRRHAWTVSWKLTHAQIPDSCRYFCFLRFSRKSWLQFLHKIYARIKAHVLLNKMASSNFWLSRRHAWTVSWKLTENYWLCIVQGRYLGSYDTLFFEELFKKCIVWAETSHIFSRE